MKGYYIVLLVLVVCLLLGGVVAILYFVRGDHLVQNALHAKPRMISSSDELISDVHAHYQSWLREYFNLSGWTLLGNDKFLGWFLVRGPEPLGQKLAFISNFNHTNALQTLRQIRKAHPSVFVIMMDGEPKYLTGAVGIDILITTKLDKQPDAGLIIYLPYYIFHFYMDKPEHALLWKYSDSEHFLSAKPVPPGEKTKFCVFAYGNCNTEFSGVRARQKFYRILNDLSGGRVDNLGICLSGGSRKRKQQGDLFTNDIMFRPYRFCIVFENEGRKGYVSEKIANAMMAGCIPIYLGALDITDYFNPGSFIHVREYGSLEKCAEAVLKIDENKQLYEKMCSEPWVVPGEETINRRSRRLLQNMDDQLRQQTSLQSCLFPSAGRIDLS